MHTNCRLCGVQTWGREFCAACDEASRPRGEMHKHTAERTRDGERVRVYTDWTAGANTVGAECMRRGYHRDVKHTAPPFYCTDCGSPKL